MIKNAKKAHLLLADGTEFEGYSFGATGEIIGEIVFTTAMTGYEETLTDPSYYGQIVTQTFPLIGNYGVNSQDYESKGCYLSGYVVREWCEMPSNFRCESDIDTFLKEKGVVGLYGIDTRALTRIIRESGVMNGMITNDDSYDKQKALEKIKAFSLHHQVDSISVKEPVRFHAENAKYHVALIDYGHKFSIRRELLKWGCDVTVLPNTTTSAQIIAGEFDGVVLSNGPGDPMDNAQAIENLKEIAQIGIPIFGICLGHQLLAISQGARCEKLKYGHRGENQPVRDITADKTYVTSQNHGFAVRNDSIDANRATVRFVNANDGSCEGIVYKNINAFTVQFHPEACGGPQETGFLFKQFLKMLDQYHK